jgi:hypothetical protein
LVSSRQAARTGPIMSSEGAKLCNRRHQEAREDKTRWYQARLEAYADFYRALSDWSLFAARDQSSQEDREKLVSRLRDALGLIQLLGSPEVALTAHALFREVTKAIKGQAQPKLTIFVFAARKDLGYTVDRSIQREIDRVLPSLDEEE